VISGRRSAVRRYLDVPEGRGGGDGGASPSWSLAALQQRITMQMGHSWSLDIAAELAEERGRETFGFAVGWLGDLVISGNPRRGPRPWERPTPLTARRWRQK
jgi:hypothetical protein